MAKSGKFASLVNIVKAVTLSSEIMSSAVVKSIPHSVHILEENTVFEEVIGKVDTGSTCNAYTGDDMKKPDEHATSEAGSMKEERSAAEASTSVLIMIRFVYLFVFLLTCLVGCLQPLRSQATSDIIMCCVL